MVLGSLAILTMMLAEFQADTSATLASAMADRDGVQAEYVARSSVNLARLLISMRPAAAACCAPAARPNSWGSHRFPPARSARR